MAKDKGLEERLNLIVAKQEVDTAEEHAAAEHPPQQHNAYAEHELGMHSGKSVNCTHAHNGIGILSHAAAACKTAFNAAVSICNKPNYLMSSNLVMGEFDCLSLAVFPMQASKDASLKQGVRRSKQTLNRSPSDRETIAPVSNTNIL